MFKMPDDKNRCVTAENLSVDVSKNVESSSLSNDWVGKSISEEVINIAEENLKENGFIFIQETGSYYNSNQKCYYSPDNKLYYYIEQEAYYIYDEESESLKFYSYSSKDTQNSSTDDAIHQQCHNDELEMSEEVLPEAPCLRLIVKSSKSAEPCVGMTFVVTCHGALLGRKSDNMEISLPDQLISKVHTKFRCSFYEGEYRYAVEDAGSTNGTFLNCKKIESNVEFPLSHGSVVKVGSTELLCHIHDMYEVCSECSHSEYSTEKQSYTKQTNTLGKHKYQLSHLKKKFGLNDFIPSKLPRRYIDRAEERRITKGSSCDYEKTESTSIHSPIRSNNKGYILLKKMGWSEENHLGDSLNNVINENWEPILDDMRQSFQEAMGAAFKEIANRIFTKVPISNLLKDY